MYKIKIIKDCQVFLKDYSVWLALPFNTKKANCDKVYELRYDLYELDAVCTAIWIEFVRSEFRSIVRRIDDVQIKTFLSWAIKLRRSLNYDDAAVVGSYIEYLHTISRLYSSYRKIVKFKQII